jgi:type I restriction enzyme R subunit
MNKEANARIKINKLLEEAGWRFFDTKGKKANIQLEKNVRITQVQLDELGEDFEKSTQGYIDYLLLDEMNYPVIVLEAKRESKDPLDGKEQARRYAKAQGARFVILSNGNIHYFWDLEKGNPSVIIRFPTPQSIKHIRKIKPNPQKLINEPVKEDYILLSQYPGYENDPDWQDESRRQKFLFDGGYSLLRKYQLQAVQSIQKAVANKQDRFLFEMATGTGKTMVAAAVIRLFLRTGNANRVLFLVDRIELENQAKKAFQAYLKNDYIIRIYKEGRDDWEKANILISTVQSLYDNYNKIFSPTDFDLVISDEAHRSINGNARALFEYFGGYKLGLTATPKDYLKNVNIAKLQADDPRSLERRIMLDTYKTFGCESGDPTFQYTLLDGVKEGYLLNPVVIDARTHITTQLLSDKGYQVMVYSEDGSREEKIFKHKSFEKKFFSAATNRVFCETFIQHALHDPLTNEIGKSIVFCVSQKHAAKITRQLNELADKYFPDMYNSDFAVQITSNVTNSQQMSINFQNNNLNGYTRWQEGYKTSRSRVCVTVGMMTTGYDCTDLLNLAMLRPIFSPSDFIQIKGRGTRKHNFKFSNRVDGELVEAEKPKEAFHLFDFFANCEYFEKKYRYDVVLKLPEIKPQPSPGAEPGSGGDTIEIKPPDGIYTYLGHDMIRDLAEQAIGLQGMKVDRQMFNRFADEVNTHPIVKKLVEQEDYPAAEKYISERIFNRPEDYYNLPKLRKSLQVDWRAPFRLILDLALGRTDRIKNRNEVFDEEFNKFLSIHHPESRYVPYARRLFTAYLSDEEIRKTIDMGRYGQLMSPLLSIRDIDMLNGWKQVIPQYIKDYIPLNYFMN